ncbi:GH36 C-terminal domain-containing protein [Sphingobacterium cavernae]|uniref:GH36 C-terminal domain-containing protein n=1 Tax=Sphingobacterium cavernae TaxID=2592657 RepID=UPI001CB7ECA8|nr:GH36 C-terminal domain-containing protein [Sphingobacterium cavernae]
MFSKLVLKGLDPNKKYIIKEINLMPNQKPQFNRNEQTFSGDYLMKVGLDWYLRGSIKSSILEITSN